MEKRQLSGWSLVGLGILILILFLLFPALTFFLIGLAVIVMVIFGIIVLIAG